jgi:hypothetical protein
VRGVSFAVIRGVDRARGEAVSAGRSPAPSQGILMFRMRTLLAGWAILGCALTAAADTIYVNGDCGDDAWTGATPDCVAPDGPKATIQAGIDAAVDGDEVVIANGTYTGDGNRDLDFGGKAIAVQSASGDPDLCVIACEGTVLETHIGAYFHSGEGPSTKLIGVTITGGHTSGSGGAVWCSQSSPTISNCVIRGNSAAIEGGGVYCSQSSVLLSNCIISNNTAYGGGVSCSYASPVLANCTIVGNTYYGLNSQHSDMSLLNCIVWDNQPGAIHVNQSSDVSATHSDIEDGIGWAWFGAGCIDVDPLLTPDGHLTAMSPCINSAAPDGGYGDQRDIDDEPRLIGAGVDMGSDEWFDTDGDGLPDWWETAHFGGPTAGDAAGDEDQDGSTNLEEYQSGTNPLGGDTYHVDNTGNDDWDGLAPQWDGEHGPKRTIQSAIDACHPGGGDEVVIADGTYTGPGNRDLDFGGRPLVVRSASGDPALCIIDCAASWSDLHRGFYFHSGESVDSIVEGVTITGGYVTSLGPGDGLGGGVLCIESGPQFRQCVIFGNTAGYAGGGIACEASNPLIMDCAIAQNSGGAGGGVYCADGSGLALVSCTCRDNTSGSGGGVYCSDSSAALRDCIISNNTGSVRGGGVVCHDSDARIAYCTIAGNTAPTGGGVYCEVSSPVMTGCLVAGNTANEEYGHGGGLYFGSNGAPLLVNCEIVANATTEYQGRGGGVYCHFVWATLVNCTIVANTAWGVGAGGMWSDSGGSMIENCVIWGNSPHSLRAYDATLVRHSNVEEGAGQPWFGEGCIDVDPLFVDPDGPDNDPDTWEDNDYRLSPGSPCIDAGDSGAVPADVLDLDGDGDVDEPVPFDLDGLPRFVDDPDTPDTGVPHPGYPDLPIVDMGAYEFQAGPAYNPGDLNCDGVVSPADIDPFVIALTDGQAAYEAQFPECNFFNADCNDDGIVSAADIDPFIGILIGG